MSETTSAAGATNTTMFLKIEDITVPRTGSELKLPLTKSSAIVAIKKLFTSFAVMLRKPTINPRSTSIQLTVGICRAGIKPATIANKTPIINAHWPVFDSAMLFPPFELAFGQLMNTNVF